LKAEPSLASKPGKGRHLLLFAGAWLATLLSAPPLAWLATGLAAPDTLAGLLSSFQIGLVGWGLPATIAGWIAWPWLADTLSTGRLRTASNLIRVAAGGGLGLAIGVLIGLMPALAVMAGHFEQAWLGSVGLAALFGAVVGGATGLIWAGWYVALDVLVRPKA
jgi:hypothetical protein